MKDKLKWYEAVKNTVVDQDGKQIAVVLPSNCSRGFAARLAQYAAHEANKSELAKRREKQQ